MACVCPPQVGRLGDMVMAFSAQEGKGFFQDWITHFAKPMQFKRFLDIGCGAGWYGQTIRMMCGGTTQIDAVEVFPEYIERHKLDCFYNRIIVGDIRKLCGSLNDYDLIIMGDILEHLTHDEAIEVVKAIQPKCRFLWCAIPINMGRPWSTGYIQPDCDFEENPYNKHLYDWTGQEVQEVFQPLWLVPYVQTGMFLIEGGIR